MGLRYSVYRCSKEFAAPPAIANTTRAHLYHFLRVRDETRERGPREVFLFLLSPTSNAVRGGRCMGAAAGRGARACMARPRAGAGGR